MRITIVNLYYPPDLAPTGRLAESLANHRASLGDQVTIVTGSGRYAPESASSTHDPSSNPSVHRIWTPGFGKGQLLGRLMDYLFFYLGVFIHALLLPAQELVISLTTPPMIAWAGALHASIHPGVRLVLWNMDCYPEIAEATGIISPGGPVSRFLRWLNTRLFRRLDGVVCLDQAMHHLLQKHYLPDPDHLRWTVISNWEPTERFAVNPENEAWPVLSELELDGCLIVLYMGNAGAGHRFETVIKAAGMLADDPVAFVFVGGGSKWPGLKAAVQEARLSNVYMFNYIPDEQVELALSNASCGLITLREDVLGVISPSKLHSYLAMGLPVIYIGPAGSNVDDAIQRFDIGVSVRQGDAEGVVDFIHRLQENPALLSNYHQLSQSAFESAYTDRVGLSSFDAFINSLVGE